MPTYEYRCRACGHEFEREQRITDDPVKTCPECRSRKVKKLISQTSFVLKGGGWYSDLYSSSGGKDEKADEGKSAEASSESSDTPKKDDKSKQKSKDKSSGGKGKGGGRTTTRGKGGEGTEAGGPYRGWAYAGPSTAYGSMTGAGLSSLAVAAEMLKEERQSRNGSDKISAIG